jgi:hypothetical protein
MGDNFTKVVGIAVFLKPSAIEGHFIGGLRTRGPRSSYSPYLKLHAREQEKHYAGGQSYRNDIFQLINLKHFLNNDSRTRIYEKN